MDGKVLSKLPIFPINLHITKPSARHCLKTYCITVTISIQITVVLSKSNNSTLPQLFLTFTFITMSNIFNHNSKVVPKVFYRKATFDMALVKPAEA